MTARVEEVLYLLDGLSDPEVLDLHREVCRRAAAIYKPLYQEKRDANYAASRHVYGPEVVYAADFPRPL